MAFSVQRIPDKLTQWIMPLLSLAVALSLVLVSIGSWNTWKISQNFHLRIADDFQLQRLSGDIIHLDEVLTMSARMSAATGERRWEQRYRRFEPKLDTAIQQAIELAPEAYEIHAVQTDAANRALVAMENRAFDLVRQGDTDQAIAQLFSQAYATQKQIYAAGMQQTKLTLQDRIQVNLSSYSQKLEQASTFSIISLLILIVAWMMILSIIYQYLNYRKQSERKLRTAAFELEQSNQKLQQSQVALNTKATDLENTLSDLKQAQLQIIQTEKMSSLGQLVAGIAHEINNPVSFIYGNLSHVQTYAEDLLHVVNLYQTHYPHPAPSIQTAAEARELAFIQEDLPKTLTAMEVGAERITEIVMSLRNFSRMDEAECKAVDIHEGLDNTLMILQHRLKGESPREPEVHVEKQYGVLPLVECYAGALNQVFMNLLSNAIDAIEDRYQQESALTGQIKIRTAQIDQDFIEIAITDNGCGMTETMQAKIFDPFFTTKALGKGTGLGMPISYKIVVDKHHGKLTYNSIPGQGTEFKVQIPCQLTVA